MKIVVFFLAPTEFNNSLTNLRVLLKVLNSWILCIGDGESMWTVCGEELVKVCLCKDKGNHCLLLMEGQKLELYQRLSEGTTKGKNSHFEMGILFFYLLFSWCSLGSETHDGMSRFYQQWFEIARMTTYDFITCG